MATNNEIPDRWWQTYQKLSWFNLRTLFLSGSAFFTRCFGFTKLQNKA
jgi:hypothetical protein